VSRALNLLGMARKAGAIETGETNSGAAVHAGRARLLLLASDASENAAGRAEGYVSTRRVPLCRVPFTKDEISAITGKNGCSMAVLTDLGFAESFARALSAEFGEEYSSLGTQLGAKLEKAKRRRAETRREQEHSGKIGKRRNSV
jgi:ribosomal protein L7Ae-like RNA K-turn-binding protein